MDEIKVSSKGQIVVPKYLRDALNINAGTTLLISKSGNSVVLTPKVGDPLEGLEHIGNEVAMKNIRRKIQPE
ncbi:MAG TPA: AbrB/MazE/SpoVT family DNA-binding domain-containing protein [archaeon]|nr:AbrB/MazE/SpoVT family DNA-binding domain-containing protein [archaeon]